MTRISVTGLTVALLALVGGTFPALGDVVALDLPARTAYLLVLLAAGYLTGLGLCRLAHRYGWAVLRSAGARWPEGERRRVR